MVKIKRSMFNQAIICTLLVAGVLFLIASMFYVSSLVAMLGVTMIFWGVILLYILPVKHVPLLLLNTSVRSNTNNIERILNEFDLKEKGVYLPPKCLENFEYSLIFVPKSPNSFLPKITHEYYQKLITEKKDGVFLTPPGYALSMLFEKEFGSSFIKASIQELQTILPKLIVEKLELAQNLEVLVQENIVTMKISDNIFSDICKETDNNPRSHIQIGCMITSALACVLAKVTGKPILIKNEATNLEDKTMSVEFIVKDN